MVDMQLSNSKLVIVGKMIMEETQSVIWWTSELLQKYGVRKAVDFTSLNNGIPFYFGLALLPILWIITIYLLRNGSTSRSFLVKYFFNSSIFLFWFSFYFYFFKTDPLGLKPFFILIFNDFQTVMWILFFSLQIQT
jgi:hypothetical protein